MGRSRSNIARTNGALGKKFELVCARFMDEWWFGRSNAKIKTDQLAFRRTPNSGAWARSASQKPGDILAPDDFPFSIEIKRQAAWKWEAFLETDSGLIPKYWKQAILQAKMAEKWPMLMFAHKTERNPRKIMVDISLEAYLRLRKDRVVSPPAVRHRGVCFWNLTAFRQFDPKKITESLRRKS